MTKEKQVRSIVMQQMIDVYLPEKDWHRIITGIIVCVVVPLLSTLLTTYYNYKLNAAVSP